MEYSTCVSLMRTPALSSVRLRTFSVKGPWRSSSASLTVALYVYASERGETAVAFAIATILMLLTLLINLSANLVGRKLKK